MSCLLCITSVLTSKNNSMPLPNKIERERERKGIITGGKKVFHFTWLKSINILI